MLPSTSWRPKGRFLEGIAPGRRFFGTAGPSSFRRADLDRRRIRVQGLEDDPLGELVVGLSGTHQMGSTTKKHGAERRSAPTTKTDASPPEKLNGHAQKSDPPTILGAEEQPEVIEKRVQFLQIRDWDKWESYRTRNLANLQYLLVSKTYLEELLGDISVTNAWSPLCHNMGVLGIAIFLSLNGAGSTPRGLLVRRTSGMPHTAQSLAFLMRCDEKEVEAAIQVLTLVGFLEKVDGVVNCDGTVTLFPRRGLERSGKDGGKPPAQTPQRGVREGSAEQQKTAEEIVSQEVIPDKTNTPESHFVLHGKKYDVVKTFVSGWNSYAAANGALPCAESSLGDARRNAILRAWSELPDWAVWRSAMQAVGQDAEWCGKTERGWRGSLRDFLTRRNRERFVDKGLARRLEQPSLSPELLQQKRELEDLRQKHLRTMRDHAHVATCVNSLESEDDETMRREEERLWREDNERRQRIRDESSAALDRAEAAYAKALRAYRLKVSAPEKGGRS